MGDDEAKATTGRCLCGDIRFEYRGAPIEAGYCHCESCRRHTSSPFVAYVVIDKGSFRSLRPSPNSAGEEVARSCRSANGRQPVSPVGHWGLAAAGSADDQPPPPRPRALGRQRV